MSALEIYDGEQWNVVAFSTSGYSGYSGFSPSGLTGSYYVAATSGGSPTIKLNFVNGVLISIEVP